MISSTQVQSRAVKYARSNTFFQVCLPAAGLPPLPLQFTGHRHAPLAALIRQLISERRTVCEKALVRCDAAKGLGSAAVWPIAAHAQQDDRGDTTASALVRLDSAVPTGSGIVILKIGGHDRCCAHVPPDVIAANKRTIVRLRAKGAEVYLLEHNMQQQGILERADLHVESCCPHILNAARWHLNAAGYGIVVRRTLPAIEALVRKVEKRR